MEDLVVTHMNEGQWSISQEGQTLAVCPSEVAALQLTFALASKHRSAGPRAVIIGMDARDKRNGGEVPPRGRPARAWSRSVSC